MSKTLISIDNIDQFICCNKLMVDSSKILTPGARDELTKRGVEIVYGEGGCCCQSGVMPGAPACTAGAASCSASCTGGTAGDVAHYDEDMLIGVAAIIKQHYGITDPEVLRKVTLETAAAIAKGNE